jgi:hypothetical protein
MLCREGASAIRNYGKTVLTNVLANRLADYCYGYWRDAHMTAWPTIREAAKALRVSQTKIADAIEDDDRLGCTYYLVEGHVPLGDHFVEAYNDPRTETDWERYWRDFNRPVLRVIAGGVSS